MARYLNDFVYVSQGVLWYLVASLTVNVGDISCNGLIIPFFRLYRIVKFGSKKDEKLQGDALGMLKEVAEKENFTLGEVKVLLYVASLDGRHRHLDRGKVRAR
jgi:hypothetical protein